MSTAKCFYCGQYHSGRCSASIPERDAWGNYSLVAIIWPQPKRASKKEDA